MYYYGAILSIISIEGLLLSISLSQGLYEQDLLYVQFYLLIYVQGLGGLLYHYILPASVPLKQGLSWLLFLSALNYVLF